MTNDADPGRAYKHPHASLMNRRTAGFGDSRLG